jgi:hypothetical protein
LKHFFTHYAVQKYNMNLPSKHSDFIRLVANGETQSNAYKLSIGKKGVSKQVSEVKGSQLAKKYADLIAEQRDNLKKVVEEAQKEKVAEIAQKRIMSAAERMEWLTKLVDGTIKAKRPFVVGGKIMEYPEEPSHSDRVKALAELNKMDGSYAPTQVNQQNTGIIKVIRE